MNADQPRGRSIAIIGGGLAGLAAAERLGRSATARQRALSVTLFEAKQRTGGRAGSFQQPDGSVADYCQHVAMGCCTELLALMHRSDLLRHWRRSQSLVFAHPNHRPSLFRPAKWLPPPLHLLPTIRAMKYFTAVEKLRLLRGIATLMRTDAESLVDQTADDWLRRHWQTDRTIRWFWEPILVSALGETVDRVSMSPARKTIVDGFAATRDASDVWVPALPLSQMFGEELTRVVGDLGATVCTGEPIRRIHVADDHFELETANRDRRRFDHVILASPWYRWGDLFDETPADLGVPMTQISDIAGSPITGIHLWFDRPVLRGPHVVMLETVSQWLFASPTQASEPGYVQAVISASHAIDDRDRLVGQVVAEIRQLDPSLVASDVADAVLVRSKVVTDRRSVFSVTPRTERLRPDVRTGHPGLFLAGDIVATGWPATMEGAVISGRRAAEAILRDLQKGSAADQPVETSPASSTIAS